MSGILALIGKSFAWGIVAAGVVFVFGFVGPMIFMPESNLGPIMGFIYAPVGFFVGTVLGFLGNSRKALALKPFGKVLYFSCFLIFFVAVGGWMNGYLGWQQMRAIIAENLPHQLKFLAAPGGVLKVWRVGPPYDEKELSKHLYTYLVGPLMELGGTWEATSLKPADFPDAFRRARQRGRGPDIVGSDNYRVFRQIFQDPNLKGRMLAVSDNFSFRRVGRFAFVDLDSPNFELARKLALWDVYCPSRQTASPAPLTAELDQLSIQLATAYLTGDETTIREHEDDKRLILQDERSNDLDAARVVWSRACGFWGNSNLAFAEVRATYEADRSLGRATILLVFRKRQDRWRLLAVARDPVTRKASAKLAGLLRSGPSTPNIPEAATLAAPLEGEYPNPPEGQRFGNFVWQPSASPSVVAEIVEFAYRRYDDRSFGREDVRLFVFFRSPGGKMKDRISTGYLLTTGSLWKWRVWSVTDEGAIEFSETRSFSN